MTTKENLQSVNKGLNKFFDFTINVDNYLDGKRMKIFLISSLIIVVGYNICDWLKINSTPGDLIFILLYFSFILNTFFAWIGLWRDDNGNWTWKRFMFKIKMYIHYLKESQKKYKNKNKLQYLYQTGLFLFFTGISLKSIHLLIIYLRWATNKLVPNIFSDYVIWFNAAVGAGAFILIYLGIKHKEVFDLKALWSGNSKAKRLISKININSDYIINMSDSSHVSQLIEINNNNNSFKEFITTLSQWKPKKYHYEYEYEDNLQFHFKLNLQNPIIERQKFLTKIDGIKLKPDIIINDNVLIEMKTRDVTGEFDRVQGQLNKYASHWKEKGPVVLIINNVGYDITKKRLNEYFTESHQLKKNVIAFVC